MGDKFDVDVGEVRAHAATVGSVSEQVNAAQATHPAVAEGAFGEVAAFFATAVTSAGEEIRDVIAASARSVSNVQGGLDATADLYEQIDDRHAQLLRVVDEGDGSAGTTPAVDDTPFQQGGITTAQLSGQSEPSSVGQRAKAVAVLERISKEHPISVATVALRPVRTAYGWVGNLASAEIGDHYEKDAAELLRQPPTDANLRKMADAETKFWNSDRGNWVGALMPAGMRYSMLVGSRDDWLNEFPPAERDRLARQLDVHLDK